MRLLPAASHRIMPWKNGGGSTAEIAIHPPGASLDTFEWRVSRARVDRPGAFSRFAGCDRALSIVAGGPLTLALDDRGSVRLDEASDPLTFAADRPTAVLAVSSDVEDLSVIWRRGTWTGRVERWRRSGAVDLAGCETCLVFAATAGQVEAGAKLLDLQPGDAAMLDPAHAANASLHLGSDGCFYLAFFALA